MDVANHILSLLTEVDKHALPLRILNIVVEALALLFFLGRVVFGKDHQARPTFLRLLSMSVLIMVLAITQYVEVAYGRAPDWLYLLTHVCFPLGELVGHVAFVELLESRTYTLRAIMRLPLVRIVLVLLSAMALIEVAAGQSGSFNLTRLFRDDWAFLISNAIFCITIIAVPLGTLRLLVRGTRQRRNVIFNARCALGVWGCALAMVGPLLGIVNIFLFLQGSPLIVPIELFVNYVLLNVTLLVLVVAFAVPTGLFERIAGPLVRAIAAQQQRQERWIHDLHTQFVQVAPSVQLIKNPPLVRKLVEISEARLLLWSNTPHDRPPTPAAEARMLRRMQQRGVRFSIPGDIAPQLMIDDVFEYNLEVAQRLRCFELPWLLLRRSDHLAERR